MRKKLLIILVLIQSILYAETPAEIAEKAHIASVNTLLIFTSQEGLNSGLYHFSNVGADMEVYHLPFTYQLHSDNNLNYFIVGNVGYSRVFISDNIDIPPNSQLSYDNHLRTYTAGIGAGARYKLTPDLSISGGVEFIYSKSGASVKQPDDSVGDAIEDFFNKNYNDNLSYEIFASLDYRTDFHKYKPYAILTYKAYETKSSFSFNELDTFNTQSYITTLSLGAETPKILEFGKNYLTLEGYYNANYLRGIVESVVGFDTYSTIGGVAYYNTPDKAWYASRYFFEISTVQSIGLEGYNVGIGFTLDF